MQKFKMVKKTDNQLGKIEREYVIPLRGKYQHVPRYKKTPKAIKEIKVFLVKHMRVRDRDLNKIKLDGFINEFMWARGIKNPQPKIKVKAVKDEKTGIVKAELVDLPNKLKFKKVRAEKLSQEAQKAAEKNKKEVKGAEVPAETDEKEKPEEKVVKEKKEEKPKEEKKEEKKPELKKEESKSEKKEEKVEKRKTEKKSVKKKTTRKKSSDKK